MITFKYNIEMHNIMVHHGHTDLQNEVCGVGLGHKDGNIWEMTKFVPIDNVIKDPKYEDLKTQFNVNELTDYIPHPTQFMAALMLTTHVNLNNAFDLITIFHTHPHNMPIPSYTDIMGSGYEAVYIIYSPKYKKMTYNYYDGVHRGFHDVIVELG